MPERENMTTCKHLDQVHDQHPKKRVCEDCVKTGDTWVHLRVCLSCGHVGCCDSSKNKHATRHYHESKHPIVQSIEPGEDWGWCYADEVGLDLSRGVAHATIMR
jgi:uncharacterized UBP type Zn finger protein